MEIRLYEKIGNFAEDKDLARKIRIEDIMPVLNKNEKVILNFKDVETATQSFIHALISEVIKEKGPEILDKLFFKNCNETIQKIIEIVIEYMQDSI